MITAESLRTGITTALSSAFCQTLTLTDPLADPLAILVRGAGFAVGGDVGSDIAGGVLDQITNFRNSARRWVCGGDPVANPPATYAPPWTGGQCLNGYEGRVRVFRQDDNGNSISAITNTTTQSGPWKSIDIRVSGSPPPGTFLYELVLRRSPENTDKVLVSENSQQVNFPRWTGWTLLSLTPQSGNPDNCGDPPIPIPDGSEPVTITEDIEGVDDQGNPVTLPNVEFVLENPTFNAIGNLEVNVSIPSLEVCGVYVLADGGEFTPGPCGNTSPAPKEQLQEPEGPGDNEPDPALADEEPEPEVEQGETIVGVQVNSQANFPSFSQGQAPLSDAPVTIVPRIASVSFKIELEQNGQTVSCWSAPQNVQSVNAFVEAPTVGRCVNSAVQWEPAFTGQKTNIFALIEV